MKKIYVDHIINVIIFLYILSLYVFTFQTNWNLISNVLALMLIYSIVVEFFLSKRKFVFNSFLILYLLFIIACMISLFFAIKPSISLAKIKTLIQIYVLMLALINYVNTYNKLIIIIKSFMISGLVASVYILLISDLSLQQRFGGELGNINEIGMIVGIAAIFTFYYIIKSKNYWYLPCLFIDVFVVLLTGSRKSLLFVLMSIVIILVFQGNLKLGSKLKSILLSVAVISLTAYIIIRVPIFNEMIGKRMFTMVDFVFNDNKTEGSLTTRSNMIAWGWRWFKDKPITGYGIDNYRVLYERLVMDKNTYSHNNLIELLVGTGILGTTLYYVANIIVIKNLVKVGRGAFRMISYCFIAIIFGYMLMSIGLVYYYDKHISILLAIGSIIYELQNQGEVYE